MVTAHEDVGDPEILDRGEDPGQLCLGKTAQVEQIARVNDRGDLLVLDDPLHDRVLIGAVDI